MELCEMLHLSARAEVDILWVSQSLYPLSLKLHDKLPKINTCLFWLGHICEKI